MSATEFEAKLPKWVYIGHYDFRVFVVEPNHPKLADDEGNPCYGMTYTGDCAEIYVQTGMSLKNLLYTVTHEVNHAINWFKGLEDGMSEEHFTTEHSHGETDLWIDNPRLINWKLRISRAIRKQRSGQTED